MWDSCVAHARCEGQRNPMGAARFLFFTHVHKFRDSRIVAKGLNVTVWSGWHWCGVRHFSDLEREHVSVTQRHMSWILAWHSAADINLVSEGMQKLFAISERETRERVTYLPRPLHTKNIVLWMTYTRHPEPKYGSFSVYFDGKKTISDHQTLNRMNRIVQLNCAKLILRPSNGARRLRDYVDFHVDLKTFLLNRRNFTPHVSSYR